MNMHREILADWYGITVNEVEPLVSTGGALKSVYRVPAGGSSYVLKRYRTDFRTLRDVTAIYEAQSYLLGQGLPIAAVVPNRAGGLVSPGEGGSWVLYRWVGGQVYPQNGLPAGKAAALGEVLGQMTVRLAGWPTDWAGAEPFEAYPPEERAAYFEQVLRRYEQGSSPLDAVCVQILRYRIGALERLAGYFPRILAMERQWLHGDMNPGNVVYDGDRIAAVIDFDNIRRAPRTFDLMYALASFFPPDGPGREEFARAYFALARPTVAELELAPAMWAYTQVCAIWPLDQYDLGSWKIMPSSDRWEREIGPTTEWLLSIGGGAGLKAGE